MSEGALKLAKAMVMGVWLLALAAVIVPGDGLVLEGLRWTFWGMAIAHLIEFAVFYRELSEPGEPMQRHFFGVLLFGVFHLQEERARRSA